MSKFNEKKSATEVNEILLRRRKTHSASGRFPEFRGDWQPWLYLLTFGEPYDIRHVEKLRRIVYAPPSEKSDDLMEIVAKRIGIKFYKNWKKFNALLPEEKGAGSVSNATELRQYVLNANENCAVVIFKVLYLVIFITYKVLLYQRQSFWEGHIATRINTDLNGDVFPRKFNYTIRMKRNFRTESYKSRPEYYDGYFGGKYNDFVALQWAIDTAYIELQSGARVKQNLSVQRFPKPVTQDKQAVSQVLSLGLLACTLLSPLTFFLFQVSRLVQERCSGIQELMHMMGVPLSYLQASHVVNAAGAWLVLVAVGTPLAARFLPPHSWLPVAALLFLYFAYIVALAFFCSTLLKTENKAVTLAFTVFAVTHGLAGYVSYNVQNSRHLIFLLSGLLPHVPVHWFWNEIGAAIRFGRAVSWCSSMSAHDEYSGSMGLALLTLVVQTVLLAVFAQYLSIVRPGKYGVAKRFDYMFRIRKCVQPGEARESEQELFSGARRDGAYFEEPPAHLEVGISVSNVSKVFSEWRKPKTVALNNVSLEIYSGEITVLLGHNGAGKTTLMSIITGMYGATAGKVYMKGRDVLSDGTRVRKSIGLCPQHNLAFDDLTVRQHFTFFAMLKGVKHAAAVQAGAALLARLRLEDKAECMSRELSGGMRRRLQLGCALTGDPDVLVLDEPTSGLDVETRRELWNLLLALRGERTVLLTTHFMEEADALGDRVAALHAGRLRCHATPMFLKRAIGTGYRLSLTLEKRHRKKTVREAVVSVLPDAQLTESSPSGMAFSLPARDCQLFPELFNKLEERKKDLHIGTMGVGVTTLEEVFLKLCSDVSVEEDVENGVNESSEAQCPSYKRLVGLRLMMQQFGALFRRQLLYLRSRNPFFILTEILLPIAAVLFLAYILNKTHYETHDENPAVAMNLEVYKEFGPSKVLYNMRLDRADEALKPFRTHYRKLQFVSTADVVGDILREGDRSMYDYYRLLLALELNTTSANALYSTTVRHALPVAVNTLTNLLAKMHLDWTTDPFTITTVNHPIPISEDHYRYRQLFMQDDIVRAKSLPQCYVWSLCMAALCASFLSPMIAVAVTERVSGARHARLMTGVPCGVYFGAMSLLHVGLFSLTGLPAVLLAAGVLDHDHTFDNPDFLGALLFIVLLHALAYTAFMYLLSYFTSETGAGSVLNMLVLLFALVMPAVNLGVEHGFGSVWPALVSLSMAMPPYDLALGLSRLTVTAHFNAYCRLNPNCTQCCHTGHGPPPLSYFDLKSGAGPQIIAMFLQTLMFWVAVYLLERGVFNRWWDASLNRAYRPPEPHYRDLHVSTERDYVKQLLRTDGVKGTLAADTAFLSGVHKQYRSATGKPHLAVRGVTLSVKHGECFGLLGVNGAGKSTVFKMLTGSEHATRGNIHANGHNLASSRDQYLSTLTYCPQFGGLDEFMSGWDNVELMVRLRGVPEPHVRAEVASWIQSVDLGEMKQRLVCEYSGGCARRCATAAALAGAAGGGRRLALLDEPTAGVDPGARRRVWRALRRSLRAGLSAVISSHSMDETEALCNRIAIMSRGEVGALGSAAALRAAHATGYSAQIKLRAPSTTLHLTSADSTDAGGGGGGGDAALGVPTTGTNNAAQQIHKIKEAVHNTFNSVLKDEHKTMLHYHIVEQIRYSELFQRMESIKERFPDLLEDYTISETTLEEVFLSFARDANAGPPAQANGPTLV